MLIAVHPCPPLVCFCDAFDHSETDSCTGRSAIRTRTAGEALKDLFPFLEGNERALVANTDQYLRLFSPAVDGAGRVQCAVFGRVIEELKDRHFQEMWVGPYGAVLHGGLNVDGVLTEFLRGCLDAALDELCKVNLFSLEFEIGVVESGCAEKMGGEIVEMAGLSIDESNELLFSTGQGIHFQQTGA